MLVCPTTVGEAVQVARVGVEGEVAVMVMLCEPLKIGGAELPV